jgi:tRNA-splicing ligase RtcB (3'-phosphate/5'-hydroxy nucleic acid ligase)
VICRAWTRKGAVRAREGDLGIIHPGSMGNAFVHRARERKPGKFPQLQPWGGRAMSRNEAKKKFTVADPIRMTEGVECRKDADVIDETPINRSTR